MKKHILYICVCACAFSHAIAQNLNTSYFMDGVTTRHELNPAFEPEYNYVSMPLLGNIGVNLGSNFGLKDFIKKTPDGHLVTFLHPSISSADVKFKDNNRFNEGLRLQLLGFGFRAFGGYNTFGLTLREDAALTIPGALFDMAKNLNGQEYEIPDASLRARSYIELALGHSHQIGDNLRIGAKAKILLGAAYANMTMQNNRINLSTGQDWSLATDARLEMGVKGLQVGDGPRMDFDNMDVKSPGLSGAGLAFDLGAEYAFDGKLDGLKVSASLLDLGFMRWNSVLTGENIEKQVNLDDVSNFKELERVVHFSNDGVRARSTGLAATLNIGAEYALPMYQKLKFGFLSSTRINGPYSYNEERLSASIAPVRCLELGISGGVGTYGGSFGWVLNIKPRGFNLYVGMDRILGKLAKPGIPMNGKGDVYVGLNFTFGKRK